MDADLLVCGIKNLSVYLEKFILYSGCDIVCYTAISKKKLNYNSSSFGTTISFLLSSYCLILASRLLDIF